MKPPRNRMHVWVPARGITLEHMGTRFSLMMKIAMLSTSFQMNHDDAVATAVIYAPLNQRIFVGNELLMFYASCANGYQYGFERFAFRTPLGTVHVPAIETRISLLLQALRSLARLVAPVQRQVYPKDSTQTDNPLGCSTQ